MADDELAGGSQPGGSEAGPPPVPTSGGVEDLTETLTAPLGDLIAAVGRGVAEAQEAMDRTALETYRRIYGGRDEGSAALRALGYQPTWYRIPELDAEISVSLSVEADRTSAGGGVRFYAAPVDAAYSNKYEFQLEAASRLKFKVVPVPPSPEAERLRVVPYLEGTSYRDATARLDDMGIAHAVGNEGLEPLPTDAVIRTEPDAGTVLAEGEVVLLWIGS